MRILARAYDAVIAGLAALGGFVLTAIFLAIVYDVTVRTAGIPSPLWTVTLAEYGLLHSTLYATPWVLRRKSHVFITIFVGYLRGRPGSGSSGWSMSRGSRSAWYSPGTRSPW